MMGCLAASCALCVCGWRGGYEAREGGAWAGDCGLHAWRGHGHGQGRRTTEQRVVPLQGSTQPSTQPLALPRCNPPTPPTPSRAHPDHPHPAPAPPLPPHTHAHEPAAAATWRAPGTSCPRGRPRRACAAAAPAPRSGARGPCLPARTGAQAAGRCCCAARVPAGGPAGHGAAGLLTQGVRCRRAEKPKRCLMPAYAS